MILRGDRGWRECEWGQEGLLNGVQKMFDYYLLFLL